MTVPAGAPGDIRLTIDVSNRRTRIVAWRGERPEEAIAALDTLAGHAPDPTDREVRTLKETT